MPQPPPAGCCFVAAYRRLYADAATHLTDDDADSAMILALAEGRCTRPQVVRWMRAYGLFRGVRTHAREWIADAFLEFARLPRAPVRGDANNLLQAEFRHLLTGLVDAVPRGWLSATSKLLWCLHPEHVVIYDAFVLRAVTVLQSLAPALHGMPPLGAPPLIRAGADVDAASGWYWRYATKVNTLHQATVALRCELAERHGVPGRHAIRITDRVLWKLGAT